MSSLSDTRMEGSRVPTTAPPIQILLITETGRTLYHYAYPNPLHHSQIHTLSAAYAAFSATVSNNVSEVITDSLILLTISKTPLQLAIATTSQNYPLTQLKALARLTLTTVYTTLSISLTNHLTNFPSTDTTRIASKLETLLNRVIESYLMYPLSATLSLTPSLPAPLDPASRALLTHKICDVLNHFKQVSHILIMTASPPEPRRIIATVSPSTARLSSLDDLLLLQLPPQHTHDKVVTPDLLFLPTRAFHKGFRVALRAVTLQIDSESFDVPVPGGTSLDAVNVTRDKALWLVALGDWESGEAIGEECLHRLEAVLDRSTVTKDLMIAMSQPWNVADIKGTEKYRKHVKAIVMLGKERFVGTIGAFGYHLQQAVLRTLELSDVSNSDFSCGVHGMLVVVCERKYVVVFDDSVSEDVAVDMVRQLFVPWMKNFKDSLMPIDEGTVVQPPTPLAGFLSPFSS